jgi:hypothetical protein
VDQNINLAECLVKQAQFGHTLISNVCNGTSQTLPWQFGDWVNFYAMSGIVVLFVAVIVFLIGMSVTVLRGF